MKYEIKMFGKNEKVAFDNIVHPETVFNASLVLLPFLVILAISH